MRFCEFSFKKSVNRYNNQPYYMNTKLKRTTIFLNSKQLERLEKDRAKNGIKQSEQIRRAIDEYLSREEKK